MDPPRSSQDSRTTPEPPSAASSEPHPGHEDIPVHTASFRKPVPFPIPQIATPPPAPMSEFSPSSMPQTPSASSLPPTTVPQVQAPVQSPTEASSNLAGPSQPIPGPSQPTPGPSQPVPGFAQPILSQPYVGPSQHFAGPSQSDPRLSQPIAGPSRPRPTGKRRQTGSQKDSEEEGQMEQEPSNARPYSMAGYGSGNGGGNGYGDGFHGAASPNPNSRRPTRAVSISESAARQSERYPGVPKVLPTLPQPILPTGAGYPAELSQGALLSRQSELDWIVPAVPANGSGVMSPVRRSVFSRDTLTANGEKNVAERLDPTLKAARSEREKAAIRSKSHGWALNVAIAIQVVLGALTTGVAAATTGKNTSIATSILGGLSTLAASYLAKARGSGEPEASARRCTDLDSFIRDCEAIVLDKGHHAGNPEDDKMIERYRRRFEEILGNGTEGVADEFNRGRGGKRDKSISPA